MLNTIYQFFEKNKTKQNKKKRVQVVFSSFTVFSIELHVNRVDPDQERGV